MMRAMLVLNGRPVRYRGLVLWRDAYKVNAVTVVHLDGTVQEIGGDPLVVEGRREHSGRTVWYVNEVRR